MMGLEPTTFGTTIRRSNQLSYNHRVFEVTKIEIYRNKSNIFKKFHQSTKQSLYLQDLKNFVFLTIKHRYIFNC